MRGAYDKTGAPSVEIFPCKYALTYICKYALTYIVNISMYLHIL